MTAPRQQHYFFSNIFIPDLLFADPQMFFDRSTISQESFAAELWEMGSPFFVPDSSEDIDWTHLESEIFSEGEIQGVLFTMPHALYQAETISSCALGTRSSDGTITSVRYFTLERGETCNIQDAVLCEWEEKRHINYGTYIPNLCSFRTECLGIYTKSGFPGQQAEILRT